MTLALNKVPVYPFLDPQAATSIKGRAILGDKGFIGFNATSSLIDEAFVEQRIAVKEKKLTATQKRELRDWNFILNKSKDSIEQHFEKRIAQLFIQAVVCFNTTYTFSEGHTLHQGFSANNLEGLKFNAAHHATVPCLYAHCETTGEKKVFLYRSGFYDESNATIDVVKEINDADRAIDEKTKTSLLRAKAITLLNQTAKGELSPVEVAKKFAEELVVEIDKAIAKETLNVVSVLRIYREKALEFADLLDQPENIDQLLNLHLDPFEISSDKAKITNQELIQRKINDLPFVIYHERHERDNESRVPCHFTDLYLYTVLSEFKGKNLEIVENAIGIEFKSLQEKVKGFTYKKKTLSLIEEHADKIKNLIKELLPLIAKEQDKIAQKISLDAVTAEKKSCLRPSIYRLRYAMITEDQQAQSEIKSHLEQTLNEVKGGSRASKFDEFFYQTILKEAQTESNRQMLVKLLNVSPTALNQMVREVKVNAAAHTAINKYASDLSSLSNEINKNKGAEAEQKGKIDRIIHQISSSTAVQEKVIKNLCYLRLYDQVDDDNAEKRLEKLIGSQETIEREVGKTTKITSSEAAINAKIDKIKTCVKSVLEKIANLQEKTHRFKSDLALELRRANGMSQHHFAEEYNRQNPSLSITRSAVSAWENMHSKISPEMARRIATIYGVNPTLFFPSHFAE